MIPKRVLFTLAGLALPVIVLALVAPYSNQLMPQSPKEGSKITNGARETTAPAQLPPLSKSSNPIGEGVEEAYEAEHQRVQGRLKALEAMSEADFAADQKKKNPDPRPGEPVLTLQRARNRTRERLVAIETMTPAQWANEQRERFKSGQDIEKLTLEQRAAMQHQLQIEAAQKPR